MKGILLFLLLIVACVTNGFTQTRTVQKDIVGTVWETPESNPAGASIPGASVRLLNAADSSLVKGMTAGSDGKFLFSGVKQGKYIVAVSFLGYATSYTPIASERFQKDRIIDLGKIVIKESSIMMSTVVIEGQAPAVVVKGDTLEYSPEAFKTQEGAVVEDLLKRLPGIEVEIDGKITSQGREVKRVFVNGREFFGRDPKMATQNLTVDMIDKVQVIEKPLDEAILTGVDDGETETIINLTIKKNMMQGWMGSVAAGAGALVDNKTNEDPRYSALGRLMKFTENSQTIFLVNANNLSRQGFTDRGNSVRSGSGIGSGSGGGNMGGGSMSGGGGGRGGITNSNTFGVNSSNIVNDKLKVGGDVQYNYSETFANSNSFRTNLLIDSVSYRKSKSNNQNTSHNVELNGKMEYKPDSVYTVVFETRLSYNLSNSNNNSLQETLAGDVNFTPVNSSDALTGMKSNGIELSGQLAITRRFEQKGRRLSFIVAGNLNHSSGNGTNLSNSEFFLRPNKNKSLNQESGTTTNTNSYSFRLSYVEPLRENMNLQLLYTFRQNGTRNIRETFDFDGNAYSSLNTDYSKSLDNRFINQTIGLTLNGSFAKSTYTIGVNVTPSYTQSTSFIKNGISEGVDSTLNWIKGRHVINFSPQVNYTYRFTRKTELRFTYRGSTRQPSVTQLDPTLNVTNPLSIRSGNPELLPSFTNTMSLRFNTNNREAQRFLTTTVDYSFTLNEIVNFTTNDYDPETGEIRPGTGIQFTAPVNENGSWNSSGNFLFSMPIGSSKRFRFSTTTQLGYRNNVGYITVKKQSQRNVTKTASLSENIGMSFSKDWFYGQLRGNVRYSNSSYTLESKDNRKDVRYSVTYNTQLTLPWSFAINSDVNYSVQSGLSDGYNKNEVIWNASISKQFLKGNRASLRLDWSDILQQRLSISRNVTSNYIEDSEFNSLTSYVMLTFSYRFNNMSRVNKNRAREEYMQERSQRDSQGGYRDRGEGMPRREGDSGGIRGSQYGGGRSR